ncbi:c-5 sterol desaturase [Neonectria magnoliae]|uniref:C-5 sterol desaturase n=1 Tax=Neonectria magnoliae TaxID=2732573 RepID=A0ABR1I952_9HYPO
MDVVLELTDTFIADYVYAFLFPKRPAPYDFPAGINATASAQTFSTWSYKPATKFISVEPSQNAYLSSLDRDHPLRQFITLYLITWIFGLAVYFIVATLSFQFIFDKRTFNHPRFIKNQVRLEMIQANKALPVMAVITAPIFLLEVRGYGKLYDTTDEGPGLWYNYFQFPLFLVFTDFCIYWAHRWLHTRLVYKYLHKPHHKWIMPTPFASHAFHPFDGYVQSLPYHIFPFIFPLQKMAYVALFIFVNLWAVMIHDGEYLTNNPIVNGAACHSLHHSRFEVNYGQFFTAFDRLGGTYRMPEAWMFQRDDNFSQKRWKAEAKKVDELVNEIEGADERIYNDGKADTKKTK